MTLEHNQSAGLLEIKYRQAVKDGKHFYNCRKHNHIKKNVTSLVVKCSFMLK